MSNQENKRVSLYKNTLKKILGKTLIDSEHRPAPTGACTEDSDDVVLHFSDGSEISIYYNTTTDEVVVEGD